jgi:uncharacterized protein (DUF697 family)
MLGVPDLWRLIRETDFESIRRDAERPFQVLLVAADLAAAETVGRMLSGGEARHPWLLPATPDDARRRAGAGLLDAALVLSPEPHPQPELLAVSGVLGAARVPFVTVPLEMPALAEGLLSAVPAGIRVALARHLPPLRGPLFQTLIEETARANALYALTTGMAETVPILNVPLNLADIVVLTKNQLVMSYRIALAAGKRGTARSVMGEVVGVIGGGFLFRQAGRQLVGLIPGAGVAPKVAVAYAGTHAIGRAVAAWADQGQRLSAASLRRFYKEAGARARAVARSLISEARTRRPRWPRKNTR